MKVNVSVIIPIKNEVKNLPRCLESMRWADEIWVVDSMSTDGSIELAQSFGAKVVQFDFNGIWPKKKNWALENLPFKHEWVFIVDADEELSPSTGPEVAGLLAGAPAGVDGYWINRRFMFMGCWLKHSYYPNWNLRLFRHAKGRYEKLTDLNTHSGDNEVHEHIIVGGRTLRMRSEMNHFAFPDIEVFIEKHNRYSNWEARVAIDRYLHGEVKSLNDSTVGWRRRLKRLSQRMPFRPTLRFIYIYLFGLGFLDGVPGYYFARMHAVYELLCIAKERELRTRITKSSS